MSLLKDIEIDYPYTVSVSRPQTGFNSSGNYVESFDTIIASMTADIQLSLKVRSLMSENRTGSTENAMWIMFCIPPETINEGDRVSDGARTFIVDAVGDWGSHTECVMKKLEE